VYRWVCSDQLLDTQRGSHPLYRTSPSKQLKDQSWSILYEDRSGASGLVYADKVVIGKIWPRFYGDLLRTGSATATSQAVEAATSISDMFQEDAADGLVGLSFGSLNTVRPNKAPTFFDNIKPTLSQALFAADLRRGAAGSYDFGVSPSLVVNSNLTLTVHRQFQVYW
jgi:aspergillopepsin I